MTPQIRSKSDRITLTNTKGAYSEALGEFVALGMLWFAKNGSKWVEDKKVKKWSPNFLSLLSSLTLGIVGYGDIGCECARVAKMGFNMKVIAAKRDPTKTTEKQRQMADKITSSSGEDLDNLLSESDFVLNVMPYTPESHEFFGAELLSKMKKTAIFMNIGRGKSVKEQDLIDALKNKVIAGAYLDVYAQEPLSAESELWNLENVYMTPHCADWSWNIQELSCDVFKKNVVGFIESGNDVAGLVTKVDFSVGY